MHRLVVLVSVLILAACGQSGTSTPAGTTPTAPTAPTPSLASGTVPPSAAASPGSDPQVTLIQLADATDPGAGGEQEIELTHQLRDDTGLPALIGPNGDQAFASLDAIEEEFAQALIADVAAALDAGEIPQGAGGPLNGMLASISGESLGPPRPALEAIDISLFADTGFTASTIMTMYTTIIQRASASGSGTLPRSESFDKTDPATGLRQQVDLSTTFTVQTGGGRVSADIVMSATDRITQTPDGTFVALYTSRSTGHFDVNACPDEFGLAEGTYTFETKHELNDVSSPQATQAAAGRSVDAPFRLLDGEDAHLLLIEATLDMQADARGPGSPQGPGPTSPFDWGATQQANIVMPAGGGTTATGSGIAVTGTGGQNAGGAMFFSSAMAQLFLAEVGREAEEFWRKGECIEINTTEESRKVDPGEEIELGVEAVGKFDSEQIEAPIEASFTGKESLDPADEPVDPPATFNFTAGSEPDDKGTIALEQVGVRGIGRKTVEFVVGVDDYRYNLSANFGGYSGQKCDGHEGAWVVNKQAPDQQGTIKFTIPEGGTTAEAHAVYDLVSGGASSHWDLKGPVTFVPGESDHPATLSFATMTGTVTVKVMGQTQTVRNEQLPFEMPLEAGDFCT